ncbi:MAG TPA: putative phage abortive infection protein [Paludibacter sp.]
MEQKEKGSSEKENEVQKNDNYLPLIIFSVIVIVFWVLTWLYLKDDNQRGTFGDMFGSVNALFSGLAMAGIIFTILLQKKELSLQRHELRDTRREFEIQNETLKKQRFENTFFQLLSLHNDIIDKLYYKAKNISIQYQDVIEMFKLDDEIKYGKVDDEASKRLVFKVALWHLNKGIEERFTSLYGREYKSFNDVKDLELLEDIILGAYTVFFKEFESVLANYFRNLYHCFKFVYLTEMIRLDEKKFYYSIIRAQLSSEELELVFYNAFIPGLGKPNFTYLIKEFDILQNIKLEGVHPSYNSLYSKVFLSVENPF